MPRIWRYLIPHRWTGLCAILAMALVAATETALPALLKPLLDNGFGAGSKEMLWLVPVALIGLAIVRGVAQFGSTYLMNRISNDVLLKLRMQIFDRMLHASAGFYQRENTATLINGVVFEVSQVLQVLTSVLITLVRDSLTVVGLLGYLLYLNWKLTLIVMVIIPVIGFLMTRINRRLRSLNRDHQARTNALSYVVEEAAGGYKVVKIHGGEAYELQRFEVMARQLRNYSMRMAVASGLNQPMTQLLASIALSIVVMIAIVQSASNQTTVGGFVAFVGAMMLIISPLKHLADISQPLQRGLTAAEMIFRMIDEPTEEEVLKGAANTPLERARGELRFEGVSFSYPSVGAEGATRPALDRVSLHVRAGEAVALVGPSGSGKTTFANLVPRFFSPGAGRILLDGMPLETLALKDLRRQIAFVSQDVILFNDTLAANIAYGATDASGIDLRRVELAVDAAFLRDVVDSLPDGLQTNIGDNGSKLSGGQRQRVAIARAIYKDAPILILDEATSALDSESERQVQAALERLMQGRTTLVIAHRLSTIEKADRIVVLEQGRIVEQGTHRELLVHDGLYAGLHRLQFSASGAEAGGSADVGGTAGAPESDRG